jgi:hypothetical protein
MRAGRTPAQRSLDASIAANTRWSRTDGHEGTERARAAGPGKLDYWLREVDPRGELIEAERERRARSAMRAYYQRLAKKSARSRSRRSSS